MLLFMSTIILFVLQWRSEIGEILYCSAGDQLVLAKYKPFCDPGYHSTQPKTKKPKVTMFYCLPTVLHLTIARQIYYYTVYNLIIKSI